MFKRGLFLCLVAVWSAALAVENGDGDWEMLSKKLKPMVVNIEYSRPIGLSRDEGEYSNATGFVVDAERGLVVTNQHVVGESPLSSITLAFSNGEATSAKLKYYDPWHDFAFLQYNPKTLNSTPPSAVLGKHSELKEGETVMLIGNSSSQGFSMKLGQINRLFVIRSPNDLGRHSHHIHLSLARSGGASGSPVFNKAGHVIGIHTSGKDNESFELRIEYVSKALQYVKEGKTPPRGDLLFSITATRVHRARKYFGFKPLAEQEYVPSVDMILPRSPAEQKLKPADLVIAIQGKNEKTPRSIGEDIFLFDQIVDENVGGSVDLTIFRDGKTILVNLPVEDAEKGKIKRFVTYAGSVFHDVSTSLGLAFDIPREGVFVSESDPGSTFEMGKPVKDTSKKRRIVIEKIGTTSIHSLDDFIRYVRNLKKEDSRTVWVSNLTELEIRHTWFFVDIDPTFGSMNLFTWNDKTLTWNPGI